MSLSINMTIPAIVGIFIFHLLAGKISCSAEFSTKNLITSGPVIVVIIWLNFVILDQIVICDYLLELPD